jgi:hypothetical protein
MKKYLPTKTKKLTGILKLLCCLCFLLLPRYSLAQALDVEDCTHKFFETVTDKNLDKLSTLLAPDFMLTGMDGRTMDRESFVRNIKEGYISVESGIIDGIRTKNYSDVSIVMGRWNVRATVANSRYFGEVTFLAVCVKMGGQWKISTIQFTPIL